MGAPVVFSYEILILSIYKLFPPPEWNSNLNLKFWTQKGPIILVTVASFHSLKEGMKLFWSGAVISWLYWMIFLTDHVFPQSLEANTFK